MEAEEIEFLIRAVEFIAAHAGRLAGLYAYDSASGRWSRRGENAVPATGMPDQLLEAAPAAAAHVPTDRDAWFAAAFRAAEALVEVKPALV